MDLHLRLAAPVCCNKEEDGGKGVKINGHTAATAIQMLKTRLWDTDDMAENVKASSTYGLCQKLLPKRKSTVTVE